MAACVAPFPAPGNWDPQRAALVVQVAGDWAPVRTSVLGAFAAESLDIDRTDSTTVVSKQRDSNTYSPRGGQVVYRARLTPGAGGYQVLLSGSYINANFSQGTRDTIPITPHDLPDWHRLARMARRLEAR